MPIILFIALIAALSGITFKAETAVPGDVLYPVKTHVDEPVVSFFSFTQNGRITAAENQAGARLSEAEQLAASGLLDTTTKSALEVSFEKKSVEAIDGIKAMAASGDTAGADAQATAFRTILEKHQVALAEAYGAKTDSASLAADVSSSVAVQLGVAESLQDDDSRMASGEASSKSALASQTVNPPDAGGPSEDDPGDVSGNPFKSAILSLLSKVI